MYKSSEDMYYMSAEPFNLPLYLDLVTTYSFLGAGTSFPFGPYEAVPDWVNQNNRHAYYAAVSYVDEHIGETLAKLRAAKLYESTVVVVRLFPSSTPPSPPPSLCSMI
jgi:membrane-anchored protein YejM (alkaline phosphatase superfamily)